MNLRLAAALQDEMIAAAIAAFPRECCGLIEGVAEGNDFRAVALHSARNLAAKTDRFELDPKDHIAAVKAARSRGNAVIGCYHSHPDGAARPSPQDQDGAEDENFLWLIAATDGTRCQLAGFVYRAGGFSDVTLVLSPAPIG